MRVRATSVALLLAIATSTFSLGGCRGTANSPTARSAPQQYPIRGTVISTDTTNGEVLLKHNDIPGLMPAMTMPYHLEDPSALSELHPGDLITATLLADHDTAGPSNLRLKDIDIIAQARPDYKPAAQYHVPEVGDVVPDFALLNQSSKKIDIQQFRGKILVVTFIYTRCPLADFCPRMSRNFAEIDKTLQANPALYNQTHLLSISFDPTYDTPKVLRSYGSAYTGNYVKETFLHWDFAAPSVDELPKMEQYFDIGVTPGPGATLQHSLSTILIGKDGKILAFYPTNDWTTAEVLEQIKSATSTKEK
jgi:protein SCO1